MTSIQTPISLWKDYDDGDVSNLTILSAREEGGLLYKEMQISGRTTDMGRVNIYGMEIKPIASTAMPALLLLPAAGSELDLGFAVSLAKTGISVFYMDYAGDIAKDRDDRKHTLYPEDISYANLKNCHNNLVGCPEGAKKTAWYEWTAAVRSVLRYLKNSDSVTGIGAIGIREGGEILWKLSTFGGLDCAICVNSVGWLAYHDKDKFGPTIELTDEERLFVAGIDSQSYAPFVKCPMLMLVSVADPYVKAERAYDTFKRINENQFSTIDYSVANGSVIGSDGAVNLGLFLDKYLKKREIFLPDPLEIKIEEKENLFKVFISHDEQGVVEQSDIYYFENGDSGERPEWIKCSNFQEEENGKSVTIPLYEKTKRVYVFCKAKFSNGFTVSSRIAVKDIEYAHHNGIRHTNILFDSLNDPPEVFYPLKNAEDFPILNNAEKGRLSPTMSEGYGKIKGVSCALGLKTGRISLTRFAPQDRSLLHFDIYCPQGCALEVGVMKPEMDGTEVLYLATVYTKSAKTWQSFMLSPDNFRADGRHALSTFVGCKTIQFSMKDVQEQQNNKSFVLNNLIWI